MLTISGVTKAYGARTLFEEASVQVNYADRIGLVGPNGAGKTTLFSLMLREISPDEGTILFDPGVSVGHLPQESAPCGDETVLELATSTCTEMTGLRRAMREHEARGLEDRDRKSTRLNSSH